MLHFRYLVLDHGHIVVHQTDGEIVEDTRYHVLVRPTGAKFTVDIPRPMLLQCSVDTNNQDTNTSTTK
jgi:hypothetical protein